MESKIARAIGLKDSPIAIFWTDAGPAAEEQCQNAAECVGPILVAASKGRTVCLEKKTIGCPGGRAGLGFGFDGTSKDFPGGIEYFLSYGYKELYNTEEGRKIAAAMPALAEGEGYYKSPEVVKKIMQNQPRLEVSTKYVVFKPLDKVTMAETPDVVVFLVYPDQLSALLVLANYEGENDNHNVIAPMGSGCSTIGVIPYAEGNSSSPRAVLGLFDISIRKHFDKNVLSFAIPFKLFKIMEGNVEGSFLGKEEWLQLLRRNS
ncbi:MAG: DUF169 domain-containing protein [Clostridia bacterium]|nr:DUF169 domain-containing protein [Clostridia bacterium]